MSEWKVICRVEDIPVLGSRRVARDKGMDVAVFRNDQNEVFALLDRCPHKGGPLSQGIVFGTSVARTGGRPWLQTGSLIQRTKRHELATELRGASSVKRRAQRACAASRSKLWKASSRLSKV